MAGDSAEVKLALDAMIEVQTKLGSDAEQLCKRHLEFVMEKNKTKDWGGKSTLYAQARMRGYGLTANWYEVKWYGKKATRTRRMVKTLILKPARGYSYTPATLAKHAQSWEEDMVREVEAGLAAIRHKASIVSKALMYLSQLERLESQ